MKLKRNGVIVEPIEVNVDGNLVEFYGNPNGSTEVKFNRVSRIATRYDDIVSDMNRIIDSMPVESEEHRCAVALLLITQTGIRIGNEDSAEGYYTIPMPNSKIESKFVKTYGLTTMLHSHIKFDNKNIAHIEFLGKKHVVNVFTLSPHLSSLVKRIYDLRLTPLFGIDDYTLTKFIRNFTSPYFSSKDFRTFRANVFAYLKLKSLPPPTDKKDVKDIIREVAEFTSTKLNNTVGVVKKSYIDPMLFDYNLQIDENSENKVEKKEKGGKIAVFAYSHLENKDNIKNIIGKVKKLHEHHLDGFRKVKKNKETVIEPDNTSTIKGSKFYVTENELNQISENMKPFEPKIIGGKTDSYDKLVTYYTDGGKIDYIKTYKKGGKVSYPGAGTKDNCYKEAVKTYGNKTSAYRSMAISKCRKKKLQKGNLISLSK